MKKIFIILLLICFASVCWAQVEDNFTDGDLTTNPTWTPDNANNWTVVSGQLRSNSGTASSSFYITTPSAKALTAQWEFYLQLQFNTSNANYVDVHLTSAQADLSSAANNGYFVRIGGTPDEISLYKVSAGTASLLINGTDGVTNRTNNPLRIKVIRDSNNNWTLERDAAGGTAYVLEGSVTDNSFTTSSYFGIRIQQSTATFFNKHFFDDITVGNIFVETDPPVLSALQVQSNSTLSLQFNEPLNAASAQTVANYVASNSIGNPSQAVLQPDQKSVLLTFPQPFPNGVSNTIEIAGVQDLVGNTILQISQPFLFFLPSPYTPKDIIVTEIFADPSPQVGLPEAEFIEIFNRSANPIDLAGWKFSDGNSSAVFPSQKIILPNQYWVVCSTANASLFSASANTLGVANFPTLNNGGEALTLKTNAGLLMDSINYSTAWYRDVDKQEGGWTLELIDTNNPCGEEDNWTASENPKGGTPGKINSVSANKPDLTGPTLLSISIVKPNELVIRFNEKLEKAISASAFTFTPTLSVSKVSFTSLSLRDVNVVLLQDLSPRQLYNLEVKGLRDCNGNFIQDGFNKLSLALPEAAETGDLFVNEILFNPRPGGVDFVEVINVSAKYINLKGWSLANREDGANTNLKLITTKDQIIPPQEFVVFTTEGAVIKSEYPNAIEKSLFNTTLPSLSDDAGSLVLLSEQGTEVDHFAYTDDFHSKLLKDKEGVSLERISLIEPTIIPDNWKSANAAAGYATPGYLNSNSRPENLIDENAVQIEPEIFSPVVPGQDFAQINYRFDQSSLSANVKIVDHQGRLIKEIANNETLAFDGFFRWDGDRDDGSKARMGYYFIWFEVFDLEGLVKTFRKRVVIGR